MQKFRSRPQPRPAQPQASFCRQITNTFNAGGSEAISMATAAQGRANGPNNNIRAKAVRGWIRSLMEMTRGTSQGIRLNERSATVTPSTNRALAPPRFAGPEAYCRAQPAVGS